ncbi:DUF3309 domain-containing protein [Methylocapsa acidiphila]|uniref:DUF3309 domain-containing protein n=1 Tax=Methylocapsa acidiphila TaxID=133552 RepID=UPI00040B935D|nr:DUF3309 domain-containing protein [Methylocapsa acidiphila]
MGIVILLVILALFAGAAYFGHSFYGSQGLGGVVALFAAIFIALWALGGLQFS